MGQRIEWDRGRWLVCDPEGYLINDTGHELIASRYKPLLEDVTEGCRAILGESLRSVLIRGSVPRGLASSPSSDMDFVVVMADDVAAADARRLVAFSTELTLRHSEVTARVDIEPLTSSELTAGGDLAYAPIMLRLQALTLDGKDVVSDLPRVRPDRNLATTLSYMDTRLDFAARHRKSAQDGQWNAWVARTLIRATGEAMVEELGEYTRDLAPIVAKARERFAATRGAFDAAIHVAIEDPKDIEAYGEMERRLVPLLVEERERLGVPRAVSTVILDRKHG